MSENIEKVKCLIIGSGPAGYTAAIYASRANMAPVLYQGEQPGGQLTTTNDVENFPGYPDGITGPEMMIQLQKQAERFGTDVRNGWITKVDFSGPVHKVWVNEETEIHADTIIISTGVPSEIINAGLDFETKFGLFGNINVQHVGEQPITDSNTLYSDSYSLTNFKIGYSKSFNDKMKMTLFYGIDNIFDEKYASQILINARGFGGNAPRYFYPGNPFNYYAGINLNYTF